MAGAPDVTRRILAEPTATQVAIPPIANSLMPGTAMSSRIVSGALMAFWSPSAERLRNYLTLPRPAFRHTVNMFRLRRQSFGLTEGELVL